MSKPRFLLHYAPRSRAGRILWLLEESGVPYEIHLHDFTKLTHKSPEYLKINPDGKVPALVDRGPEGGDARWPVVVTESAAICGYVADLTPKSQLAPPIGSPDRAAYQTWMFYAAGVLEPGFADLAFPRAEPPRAGSIGWVPFDEAVARVSAALDARAVQGPWLLGARFTAPDLMVGGMLDWASSWGKMQPSATVKRYLDALRGRAAKKRAAAKEAEILAASVGP